MASGEANEKDIGFSVEIGPNGCAKLKVRTWGKEFPLDLSAGQAGQLGITLLAASAACSVPEGPAEGTVTENCHFPVLNWGAGHSNSNGKPVLAVQVTGATQIVLQFELQAAHECGASLTATAGNRKAA